LSNLRKLASQTVVYGFTYFAGRLLNFLLTPFYTRVFAPEDFGAITLIYSYITFFNILYTYGLETGYFYFANKSVVGNGTNNGVRSLPDPVAGTSFISLLTSSLLFSGILILFSPWFAAAIHFPNHADFVAYAALILAFDTLIVIPFAYLRKAERSLKFAFLKLLNILLNIVFNAFFLLLCPFVLSHYSSGNLYEFVSAIYEPGHGIRYVFLSNVLSSLITLATLIPEIRRIDFRFDKKLWQQMLRYSWPLLILGFAGMINETLDRILLAYRLPGTQEMRLEQVGIYSACYKLSIFMTLAIASFRYAAEPFFFSQMKEKGSKELFARILKYFSFATGLIFLGILMYLPIILLILGKDYRSGLEVVPILLMANLFLGLFYYLSQWYKQTEKTLYGALISVGGAAITLGINYIFIPRYGYMASAWATFFCYFFMAASSYILGQKFYPVRYDTFRISLYIAGAAALYFISLAISDKPLGQLSWWMYILNTFLILLYILVFFFLEKPGSILKVKSRSAQEI